jgi:hypothetical protein
MTDRERRLEAALNFMCDALDWTGTPEKMETAIQKAQAAMR